MDKNTKNNVAEVLLALSIVAVLFSIYSYAAKDIWLASSQWIQVAAVLGIYAVYLHIANCCCKK